MTELETAKLLLRKKNVLISKRVVVDPLDMEIYYVVKGDKKPTGSVKKISTLHIKFYPFIIETCLSATFFILYTGA